MWVFTVLLPVTIVLWKAPGAANMDMAWHDWVFFAAALIGTRLEIRALASWLYTDRPLTLDFVLFPRYAG